MGQADGHQATVEKLYAIYTEQGFLREEEALSVMSAAGISLVGINRLTDRLMELGVIFADDAISDDDEDNDRAQTDYEAIYAEILAIAPGQRVLVDYIRNVRPPQNREWRPLITQMNSGNEYAFNRLFDMYLRVAVRIALRISKNGNIELDDAIQEGAMGLMRAIRQYNPSSHGNLASYIPLWIQQYINRAVANYGRTIRLPAHTLETVRMIETNEKKLFKQLGRKPNLSELAVASDTPIVLLSKLLEAIQEPVSLEFLLESEEDFDIIDTSTMIEDNLLRDQFVELLGTLTSKEEKIIRLRYGFDDNEERTLEEVGHVFNITRERVRQIESKAIKKLCHPTRSKKLSDFLYTE